MRAMFEFDASMNWKSTGILLLAVVVFGCSDDDQARPWELADERANNEETPACRIDSDCPEGFYCDTNVGCDGTPTCVEGFSPCSAAPPFLACGCGGTIGYFAAGCPRPYAWNAGTLSWQEQTGAACDVDATLPVSLQIEAEVFQLPNSTTFVYGRAFGTDIVELGNGLTLTLESDLNSIPAIYFLAKRGPGLGCDENDFVLAYVIEEQSMDYQNFVLTLSGYARQIETDGCERWQAQSGD